MIKQKNTKKMTASVEQSNTTAVAENQKAVSSHITMPAKKHQTLPVTVESSNLNTNHKDTGNKTSMTKPPLPQTVRKPANSKPNGMNLKGFGVIDQNAITSFCDGVQVLPVKIRSYDWMAITSDEYQLCKKVGRESYSLDAKGVPVPCVVIKTETAFAVVGQDGNAGFCKWAMSSFDFVKKVKGTDGIAYVDIQIHDEMGCQKYRVPRSVFAEGKINSLTKFNIAVNNAPESVSAMAIYFTRLLDEIPMEDASQVLGVVKNSVTQECVFNGYGEDGVFKVANQYGSYEGYLEHFNPLLEKSEALQYLLSATMAAPVMTVLQQKYNKDVHSYIINAVGLSSTGKTITSRFCAAAWTNPKDSVIFSAMHSTANASLKKLAGRYGVPTFLDEATASGIKAEEYAYSVYEGVEKERLNSDCSMRASGTWSTIICISSEEHFHMNRKNQNGGLAVRVHSMDDLAWTADAEHANALTKFIAKNYGVIGKTFTGALFKKLDQLKLDEKYDAACQTMKNLCSDSKFGFTDRLCELYALTYMTAQMLKKLGLAINVDAVAKIMVGHHDTVSKSQNLALNAFNAIVAFWARATGKDRSGIREYKNTKLRVVKLAIEGTLMSDILSKAGFRDTMVTAKALAKAGYLIRPEKGLKVKRTFDNRLAYGYEIDMSSLYDDEDDDTVEGVVTYFGNETDTALTPESEDNSTVLYDDTAESNEDDLVENEYFNAEEKFEDDADVLSEDADSDEIFCEEDADIDTEEESLETPADESEVEFDFSAIQVEGADEADADDTESDEGYRAVEEESDTEQESEDDWAEQEDADNDEYIESSGIDWDEIPIHSHGDAYEEDADDNYEDDEYYGYYE